MHSKLVLGGRIAQLAAHVARERLVRPRPMALSEVPPSADALTREWLTAALCAGHDGAQVTRIFLGESSDGTTSRRPLIVDYNEAGREAGLPTRIFCKFNGSLLSRLLTGLSGAAAAEVGFYTELRPSLEIESPLCYCAAWAPGSERSMILLEDVAATRRVSWPDIDSTCVDRELAGSMIDTLASYHGAMWNDPRLRRWTWLRSAQEFQATLDETVDFESRTMVGVQRAEDFIPAEFAFRRNEIYPCLALSLERHSGSPSTLLHQDVHPRNWYVTRAGKMGLVDWQACGYGLWALDIAYALSTVLKVEDRRAWERELLERYLQQLAAAGGEAPSFNAAWLAYRQQVFHGLVFWLFTLGGGPLQPQMQPRVVSETMVSRTAQAVIDLESFDSFDAPDPGRRIAPGLARRTSAVS